MMNSRNNCKAVLDMRRDFKVRRHTESGFLTGTIFLDIALLIAMFVLTTSPFVLKSGIALDLPIADNVTGINFNDMVLKISENDLFFFNDELIRLNSLENVLEEARKRHPETSLILEADQSTSQNTLTAVYDAATAAGFSKIFIATQPSNLKTQLQ